MRFSLLVFMKPKIETALEIEERRDWSRPLCFFKRFNPSKFFLQSGCEIDIEIAKNSSILIGFCLILENLALEVSSSSTSSGISELSTRKLWLGLGLRDTRRTWRATVGHYSLRQFDRIGFQWFLCFAVIYNLTIAVCDQ
jgi:hypothetical protein